MRTDRSPIKSAEADLRKAELKVQQLEGKIHKLKENTFDTFCGARIVLEETRKRDLCEQEVFTYELLIEIDGFRIRTIAYPNAHDHGESFVALIEDNSFSSYLKPGWFDSFIEFGIPTFDKAKETALTTLKEILDSAKKSSY